MVSLELHWHDHVRPQSKVHILFKLTASFFSRKTQPKKNADWFCEKCKGQEVNNGDGRLEIDEKGLKPNAWQTPAQRKAYSGPPSVNPAKTKVTFWISEWSVLISVF